MVFNSIEFIIFLPIVFLVYWGIVPRYRWMSLLVSSYYFYMSWNAGYVFLILATTAVSYGAAIMIEKSGGRKQKKLWLFAAIFLCIGVLFLFKYFNFAMESIASLLHMLAIPVSPLTFKLLLPVGISFYTFQTVSYVIDVYKGEIRAERHFGYYAAYVSFFPQLVAGPIERSVNLLPQIKAEHNIDEEGIKYGLRLMAVGFFRKMVIADNLSVYVDAVYNNLEEYKGFSLVLATVFFAIQIYSDFAGYSEIAIGTANLFGIRLMKNFASPYFSRSIKEFWSRWHISLSTWLRDYIYIPLGGNRCGRVRRGLNLMVTFLVSGLWHGANWTYVLWGGGTRVSAGCGILCFSS